MKTIDLIILHTGETTLQTRGFSGSTCRDASKALEQALGVVQSDKPTAEMRQGQTVEEPLRQGNG